MEFKKIKVGQYSVTSGEDEVLDKVHSMLESMYDTGMFATIITDTIVDSILSRTVCNEFIKKGLCKFDDNEMYVVINFKKGYENLVFTLGSVLIEEETKFINGVLTV